MKLKPAASPDMRIAHENHYVQTIVAILLQDRSFLRLSADFLREFESSDQDNFEKKLEGFRLSLSRPEADGTVKAPDRLNELIQTLQDLYRQKDPAKIKYQRGAIVELLARKLVCHRYNKHNEICLNNQRFFVDNFTMITVEEIDVAALSNPRRKLEGYECKVSPGGFSSYDCINLSNLADAAEERDYRSNIGFVSFANDKIVKSKLARLQLPDFIKVYGLDTIESLEQLTHMEM